MKIYINSIIYKEIDCISEVVAYLESDVGPSMLKVTELIDGYKFDVSNSVCDEINDINYVELNRALVSDYYSYLKYMSKSERGIL